MPRWSEPIKFRDYNQAPDTFGVYEIGFNRGGDFNRLYGGRAASTTVRSRLADHFAGKGRGNEEIGRYLKEKYPSRDYQGERDNLYCRWQVTDSATAIDREKNLHRDLGTSKDEKGSYAWNRRNEGRRS